MTARTAATRSRAERGQDRVNRAFQPLVLGEGAGGEGLDTGGAGVGAHRGPDGVRVHAGPVRECSGHRCAASEVGPHDQEQQHGGGHQGEAGGAADDLGGQREVLVGEAGEADKDRAVEGEE